MADSVEVVQTAQPVDTQAAPQEGAPSAPPAADPYSEMVQAQQPETPAAPEFIDVIGEDGTLYTRVQKDRVPEVILQKDRYIAELRRNLAEREQVQQPAAQTQAQPNIQQLVEAHRQEIVQLYRQDGWDDSQIRAVKPLIESQVKQYETQLHTLALVSQVQNETQNKAIETAYKMNYAQIRASDPDYVIGGNSARGKLAMGIAQSNPDKSPLEHYQMYQQALAELAGGNGTAAHAPQPMPQIPASVQALRDRSSQHLDQMRSPIPAGGGKIASDTPEVIAAYNNAVRFHKIVDPAAKAKLLEHIRMEHGR